MNDHLARQFPFKKNKLLFSTMTFAAYIAAIAGAEVIGVFLGLVPSALCHAILIPVLLSHYALVAHAPYRRILPVLALAPLLRILGLSMPIPQVPQIYWYAMAGMPLLLAIVLTVRLLDLSWSQVGLRRVAWLPEGLIAWSGLPLGMVAYLLVRPQPMFGALDWPSIAIGSVILLIFTGFTEELLFRGLLQRGASEVWGQVGVLLSVTVFISMYIGSLSLNYILFIGLVGFFFGWCTQHTGSIWGVTLAHGIINITLLLIMPYLAQQGMLSIHTTIAWAVGSGVLLSVVAIGVMLRRAQLENRPLVPSTPTSRITQPLPDLPTTPITQPLPALPQPLHLRNLVRRLVHPQLIVVRAGVQQRGTAQRRWTWAGAICLLAVVSIGIARYTAMVLERNPRSAISDETPFASAFNPVRSTGTPSSSGAAVALASPVATSTTTPTVVPTSPAGTPTSLPRASAVAPSSAPSSTPVPATPTPALGSNDTQAQPPNAPVRFIDNTFDSPARGWPNRTTNTASTVYQDGQYQLVLHGQDSVGVSTAFSPRDYRLNVDMTIIEGHAGLVFLSAAPTTFYRLVLDTEGRYAIERLAQNSNTLTRVVDWTEHSAVKRGSGVVNHLRIERRSDTITFFANDQLLITFAVPVGASVNHYGFVLTSEVGQGKAMFDNLIVERLPN